MSSRTPPVIGADTFDPRLSRIRLRQESSCQIDQVPHGLLILQLIDGGAAHLAGDPGLPPGRRHENHVARQQPGVAARIAAQQQIVEIEPGYEPAAPFELDIAQAAERLDAAAHEQGVGQCGHPAHQVRAGSLRIAQHEDTDGTDAAQRHGGCHAAELALHATLYLVLHPGKAEPRDRQRADAGKQQRTIAGDGQFMQAVILAEELDDHAVARTDDIIGGHRDIAGRGEGAGGAAEQIQTELSQLGFDRQQLQGNHTPRERGLDRQAFDRFPLAQPREHDAPCVRQHDRPRMIQQVESFLRGRKSIWRGRRRLQAQQ
jgi:hypothetical protein